MESPLRYFSTLTDPRVERTREHDLEDILFIAIASIICGAEGWNEIEEFGKSKEDWLKTFLRLPGGIPSHDTFIVYSQHWILRNWSSVLWTGHGRSPIYARMKW
ncbi:hypothetical protein FACS1894179_10200 [Bacteroidia bacterium]|nr:hypothetical protein FACS1894179_10200 [Bacteroidia bacterium]